MNEYKEVFEVFEMMVDEGRTFVYENKEVVVHSVKEYWDEDEVACEEEWANYQDHRGLQCGLVSVEDILNGEDINCLLEAQCLTSLHNGQFSQFLNQFEELSDKEEFFDYVEENETTDKVIYVMRKILYHYL